MRTSYLKQMVADWHNDKPYGIMSACTASPLCIEAAMRVAIKYNVPALIEATSNQVNQFGGYTGMRPTDYYKLVEGVADKVGLKMSDIILGGDHLGPQPFKNEPAESAMEKACGMVYEYVASGYTKIHLDTSMMLGDDDAGERLRDEVIAVRASRLAKAALEGFASRRAAHPSAQLPVFIIGSEVPVPGGTQKHDEEMSITKPESLAATIETFKQAFTENGCGEIWDNVVGIVVQPGVEFGDTELFEYDHEAAKQITGCLHNYENIIFEGHSTDYQTPDSLKQMVDDGICILKVGPALTFYQREAIFALEGIERELIDGTSTVLSDYRAVLEKAMLDNPAQWQSYYSGTQSQQHFKRKYSYSDRCRYYFPDDEVSKALNRLIENLSVVDIPISLLSQYMPVQAKQARCGMVENRPHELIIARITDLIDEYMYATVPIGQK